MSSLMEFVTRSINPDMTSSLASRFAIAEEDAESAMQTSAAATLTTIASKAGDAAFVGRIHRAVTSSEAMAAASSASASVSTPVVTAATGFLDQVFGSQRSAVEARVAAETGIPASAAAGAMTASAPLVMGALAQHGSASGLAPAAWGSVLASELDGLRSYLPASFAIPGLGKSEAALSAKASAAQDSKAPAGWLWTVLLVGALFIAGLVWYFSQNQIAPAKVADSAAATAATQAASTGTQNAGTVLGSFFKRKLPDGTELNIPENGIESKLVSFIEDSSRPVDKTTWFDFDRLLFATGSTTLEPSSNEQLANVAAIMKAYPNVDIRLGGYTDNTGDPAANQKLSEERANSVMAELVKLGVDPSRMDAKGYGDQHPVASNDTEEGRAQNRRISLRVTQK